MGQSRHCAGRLRQCLVARRAGRRWLAPTSPPMPAVDLASLQRLNQLLPKLHSAHENWQIAGLRLFLQRYYYCIATEPGYAVGTHAHDWFELSRVQSGKVEYSDTAKAQTLGPGEIFFMAPGYEHRWRVVQAPVVIDSFQLKLTPLTDAGRRLTGALDDLSAPRTSSASKRARARFRGSPPEWGAAPGRAARPAACWREDARVVPPLTSRSSWRSPSPPPCRRRPSRRPEQADGFSRDSNHHIAGIHPAEPPSADPARGHRESLPLQRAAHQPDLSARERSFAGAVYSGAEAAGGAAAPGYDRAPR